MRVLAMGQEGKVIVEAHQNELANLMGFYWTGVDDCPRIQAGLEFKVSEMYRQLYDLKHREKALAATAKDLRLLADLLELKQPVIFPPEDPAS